MMPEAWEISQSPPDTCDSCQQSTNDHGNRNGEFLLLLLRMPAMKTDLSALLLRNLIQKNIKACQFLKEEKSGQDYFWIGPYLVFTSKKLFKQT